MDAFIIVTIIMFIYLFSIFGAMEEVIYEGKKVSGAEGGIVLIPIFNTLLSILWLGNSAVDGVSNIINRNIDDNRRNKKYRYK